MTNQEQYELICEKAEKYDRLVGMLDKIRAEIDRKTEIHSDGEFYIKNIDVKRIIDKYKAESENL